MRNNIVPDKVKRALLQFGLTEKEISTYLVLLEKGSGSIQDISRVSGINRVTIYAAIDALKRKGLIAESKKGKRNLFVAESPDNLQEILEMRKEKLHHTEKTLSGFIIPSLNAIDVNQEKKPEMLFFEGKEGINRVYDNYMLKYKNIIGCGSYATAIRAVTLKEEAVFLREIERRHILYRVILANTPLDHEMAEKFRGCFHTKFMETEHLLTADIHAFGPYVSLMSYETMGTTLIKDESIAQSIKMYLEFMWERL